MDQILKLPSTSARESRVKQYNEEMTSYDVYYITGAHQRHAEHLRRLNHIKKDELMFVDAMNNKIERLIQLKQEKVDLFHTLELTPGTIPESTLTDDSFPRINDAFLNHIDNIGVLIDKYDTHLLFLIGEIQKAVQTQTQLHSRLEKTYAQVSEEQQLFDRIVAQSSFPSLGQLLYMLNKYTDESKYQDYVRTYFDFRDEFICKLPYMMWGIDKMLSDKGFGAWLLRESKMTVDAESNVTYRALSMNINGTIKHTMIKYDDGVYRLVFTDGQETREETPQYSYVYEDDEPIPLETSEETFIYLIDLIVAYAKENNVKLDQFVVSCGV
jgi:hypothetical protein